MMEAGQAELVKAVLKYVNEVHPRTPHPTIGEGTKIPNINLSYANMACKSTASGSRSQPDILATGTTLIKAVQLLKDLTLLSSRINEVLRVVDEPYHQKLSELRDIIHQSQPVLASISGTNGLLFEACKIVINDKTQLPGHSDKNKVGFIGFTALGSFKGGMLYIPTLHLKARLSPGDFIFIQSEVLQYEMLSWSGDLHIVIGDFSQKSTWDYYIRS